MALKCSVCGKFLARGTAHDHDHDRQPDARHYNPHPPQDGNSLEDENPIIVPPRRRRSPMAARGSPGGGPGDTRPGLPSGPPEPEPEDNTHDRPTSPGGGPGDTRPGLPVTNPDRPGHRPPPDDDDDEPEPDHDDDGLDSGIDRPKPKPRPEPEPEPLGVLSPQPFPGFDDYQDPGEQEGTPWQSWQHSQPAAITPQAPMLDYEEYSEGFGGYTPPALPDAGLDDYATYEQPASDEADYWGGDWGYEEYGAGTFDDTSKWWQSPESTLWLPQSRDYGLFATPEPIPEAPWYSRAMTAAFDAPLPFSPTQSLRGVTEGVGHAFSLPHEAGWWVADRFAGDDPAADTSMFADTYGYGAPAAGAEDLSAVARSRKWFRENPLLTDIHLADLFDAMMMRKTSTGAAVREAVPGASMPLLSLIPGQDLALAYSDDKAITGADWIAAAELGLEFVPVGAALDAPIRGARMMLPTKLGGGFSRVTSPATSVAKLLAGKTDEAALEASIRLRNQIAEQGFGEVEVGGQVYRVQQTALDRALREANPNATLSTTAAEDVAKFADADVMPFKPQHANNPSEQFQFRTPGGSGVLRFTKSTAYGNTGKFPGLAVYGDEVADLALPGSYKEPLDVKWYHGRELELGVPTGGQVRGVRKVDTFIDHPADLYLDEALTAPTYSQRVKANVEGVVDVLRGRKGQVEGVTANADDIARARFNKQLDELTPEEGHYVDLAKLDDETLRAVAAQGDDSATEILRARQQVADALDDTIDAAADTRTTRARVQDEVRDRFLNRARTPAWERSESGLWTRADRVDVDTDTRAARVDTEDRRTTPDKPEGRLPGQPIEDDVWRRTPTPDDKPEGRLPGQPIEDDVWRRTPTPDDKPEGRLPGQPIEDDVWRRTPTPDDKPEGRLPGQPIEDDVWRRTPPPPVRRRPPPPPPPPPRIEPPDVVIRDPGAPPPPPPERITPPPRVEDVPPVVPRGGAPPPDEDDSKRRRVNAQGQRVREAPATTETPHPKVVVREDIVVRELNLETGEEIIVAREAGPLVVTERDARPHRNRRIASGNRTVTTDQQGQIHEQRTRTRRKVHPYLRRGELRPVTGQRHRSTTSRARRPRTGRRRRR